MADCRLLPWFYSQLAELAEPPPFVPPDGRARDKWIKRTNVAWLRSHGLKVRGNAEEVKDRVAAHWDRIEAGTYPPSKPTPASDMGEFVSNFVGVVGRVMRSSYTPSHIEDTEEQIHNFLTKFKEIDESLGSSSDYDEEARSSSVEDSEVSEIGISGPGPMVGHYREIGEVSWMRRKQMWIRSASHLKYTGRSMVGSPCRRTSTFGWRKNTSPIGNLYTRRMPRSVRTTT